MKQKWGKAPTVVIPVGYFGHMFLKPGGFSLEMKFVVLPVCPDAQCKGDGFLNPSLMCFMKLNFCATFLATF